MTRVDISNEIKSRALAMGFDACGFCRAENVGDEKHKLKNWLDKGYHANMHYLSNNTDKRIDPSLLMDGAQAIISLALNYYPSQKQDTQNPQFAYYAYGKDYHDVMKAKMQDLLHYIKSLDPNAEGRCFCDTAPVLERYWAAKSGIGFIGKNSMLIIPQKGSYFFLGEILLNIELDYDKALNLSCGNCSKCIDACPTNALEDAYIMNSRKCISYQTIENRSDIDEAVEERLGNCVYGCDICQNVCPWNRFASPHNESAFNASDEFMGLSEDKLLEMTVEDYRKIFKGSAVKRAKYEGLMRNVQALKRSKR